MKRILYRRLGKDGRGNVSAVFSLWVALCVSSAIADDEKWHTTYYSENAKQTYGSTCDELLEYVSNGVPDDKRIAAWHISTDTPEFSSCPASFRPEMIVHNYFAGPDPVDAPLEF